MKRLCWIFLGILLICGLAAGVSADTVKSGSVEETAITWVLDSTGTLTFSGTGRIPDYAKTANAPRYDDKGIDIQKIVFESGITHIGSNSFYEYLTLNEIVFPETLQTIGYNAFNKCTALTKITIPESVTTIDYQAFKNCSSLQSATFLGDAPAVGDSVFAETNANFTIYFYEDKADWITPTWNGYMTAPLEIYWSDNGKYDTSWYDNNMSSDEYTITTAAELAGFAALVNEGNDFTDKTIRLGNDIDISAYLWTPIGYYRSAADNMPFIGTFDGCEYTITGLTATGNYSALFSYIYGDTAIQNVNLQEVNVSGQRYVAGLVAYADTNIEHIDINNCIINGQVREENTTEYGDEYTAGIIAYLKAVDGTASITDCKSYGVIVCESYGAGIVGYATGSTNKIIVVQNCHNYALINGGDNSSYCGGIAGHASRSQFKQCSNYGDVWGNSTSDDDGSIQHGGIAGTASYVDFVDCVNYGTIKAWSAGGIATGSSNTAIRCLNVGTITYHSDLYGCALIYYGKCEDCYYSLGRLYDTTSGVTKVTAEQLASGEICYLLNGSTSDGAVTWKQNLGSDNYPSFTGKTVYYDTNANPQYYNLTSDEYNVDFNINISNVIVGETIYANIVTDNSFSASELALAYDTTHLSFNESASTLHGASVTATNGTLTLVDYGESKSSYIFAFDSIASGTAEVTLTSAAFGNEEDAAAEDLTSAEIENGTVSITIREPAQEVVLSDILSGASSVEYGKDYTFSIKNYSEYYEYTVSAEMAGETALVIDNGSGNYMIENVTGKLDITAAGTPKKFNVVFGTDTGVTLPEGSVIVYGNDYIFSMPAQEHYSTAITQAVYTQSQNNVPYTCENGVVTIQGKDIIDNIKIVINQQLTDAKVTIAGSGADDVSGYKAYAVGGESYTLSVTEDDKYDYTVTAAVNGESVELAKVEETYTISAEDVKPGAIVFTITKTIKIDAVAVSEYLTLDGNKLWLIKNAVTKLDNMVYRYDGTDMFWSDTYEAYCAIVASSEKPEVTANNLSLANGDAVELTDEMDINMSGKIDANDAQFVYNMYNGKYSGITETVTVEKYFRADVNRDGKVNILDAAAVVSHILTQNTRMFFSRPAEPSFHFSLEADGSSEKTVHTGDIVTFTFRINRTDSSEDYIMYAMQNEIRYDRTLLELVEDSITVQENIVTNDMCSDEQNRELYINYLSKSRDEVWNADTLVGSFRMKVIGTSGSAEVSCQDSLMSRAGGNGSYPVTYSNVTLEIADVPPVPGDIDGDQQFTESDREYLAKYWAGYPGYSIEDIPLAVLDMDSDGVVTRRDAMILERHFAGWKGYETLPLRQP